jgi:TetR/AcrR family tetracycline transcriptional repressor
MAPVSRAAPSKPAGAPTRQKRRAPRAAWGTISREQIVHAALQALDSTGFEQLTIRHLAGRLGVSPMALYRHIRDKDDLLDEVVDELVRRSWEPPASATGWRAETERAADALRELLVREPAALYVYLRHPVVTPAAVARMEVMVQVLRDAGFGPEAAERAYAAVHTYTVGFAALEASRTRASAALPEKARELEGLAARLGAYATPNQFHQGLSYLLDGIERELQLHGGT